MDNRQSLEARLDAVEAHIQIGQLPIRYALAIDGRDIDTWIELFEPDVNCGRFGRGREALRGIITPMVATFYRSIHQICGHRIELRTDDTARGKTYCRAEHEDGERYIVMAICYNDEYRKVDGTWYFSRRREQHWYAADLLERPQSVDFAGWEQSETPALPQAFPTWTAFWDDIDTGSITRRP